MNTATKATVTMLAAPLALGIASGKANAQVTGRLGLSNLISKSSTDTFRSHDLSFGLGIATNGKGLIGGYRSKGSIDIDFKMHNGKGNQVNSISAAYTERYALVGGEAGGKHLVPYVGLGVGIGRTNVRLAGVGYTPVLVGEDGIVSRSPMISPDTSSYKTSVAGKVLLGVNVTQRLSVEAAYNFSPQVSGLRTETYSFSMGIRF